MHIPSHPHPHLPPRSRSNVADTQALAEWWETERAAARELNARAACYRTARWCLIALTLSTLASLAVALASPRTTGAQSRPDSRPRRGLLSCQFSLGDPSRRITPGGVG